MQLNYWLVLLALALICLMAKPISDYIYKAERNKKLAERLPEEGERELSKHNTATMNGKWEEARKHAYAFETIETVLVEIDPIGFDKRFKNDEANRFLYDKVRNNRHWEEN